MRASHDHSAEPRMNTRCYRVGLFGGLKVRGGGHQVEYWCYRVGLKMNSHGARSHYAPEGYSFLVRMARGGNARPEYY